MLNGTRLVQLLSRRNGNLAGLSYQQYSLSNKLIKTTFSTLPKTDVDLNDNVGLFQIPHLTNPSGLNELTKKAITKSQELLENIENVEPGVKTVKLVDEISDVLCRVADLAEFIRHFHPEEKYQHVAGKAQLNIATIVKQLRTDLKLFKQLQIVTDKISSELEEESRTVAKLLLADFKIAGVRLKPAKRKKVVELHEELVDIALTMELFKHAHLHRSETTLPLVEFLEGLACKLDPITFLSSEQQENLNIYARDIHRKRSKFHKLEAWDFYTSKLQDKSLNSDHCKISNYFSLGNCMQGLNNLFNSLYGVKFQHQEASKGELWSEDVVKLAVVDENNDVIGYIYCDFLDRKGKPHQNYQLTIQSGRRLRDGSLQLPKVAVCLNLNPPSVFKPTLLTPNSLINLFSEMGQAMHFLLAKNTYKHATSMKSITDFSEVPAILMEFFAKDPKVLKTFASHYKTGEVITSEVLDLMSNLYKEQQVPQMQIKYSPINKIYEKQLNYDYKNYFKRVEQYKLTNDFYSFTVIDRNFQCEAKYYAKYLVSRAIASKLWKECFSKDPFNREAGEKYRRDILRLGGYKKTKKIYEKMLGEKLDAHKLVQTLVDDFCTNCGIHVPKNTDYPKYVYNQIRSNKKKTFR